MIALALVFQETRALLTDYWTPVVSFGIGALFYLESKIGVRIRNTATELLRVANYDSSKAMKTIFDSKLRTELGGGCVLAAILAILANPTLYILWYQSPILKIYLAAIVLFLVFILGEAVSGGVAVVVASRRITAELSKHIEPLNFAHFSVLKKIAYWGVLLSAYGSVVASVLLVGIYLSPWRTSVINVQIVTLSLLSLSTGVMLYVYLTPTYYVHRLLKELKQKNLFLITSAVESVYRRFGAMVEHSDLSSAQSDAELIGRILDDATSAKALIAATPEWPWDLPALHAVAVSIFVPVLIYYLETLRL